MLLSVEVCRQTLSNANELLPWGGEQYGALNRIDSGKVPQIIQENSILGDNFLTDPLGRPSAPWQVKEIIYAPQVAIDTLFTPAQQHKGIKSPEILIYFLGIQYSSLFRPHNHKIRPVGHFSLLKP